MATVNIKMSPEDEAALSAAGKEWTAANAAGDADAKAAAHETAEKIRAKYNYSGGDDGSGYIPLGQKQEAGIYDLSEYLKKQYAAQVEAELAGLKGAYEKSMAGYDEKLERLPQQYDAARNKVAAQDAIARKSFDERAAANGLNSGTSGQVELARSSAFQRDLANLDQEQANAVSDLNLEKANLQAQYESALAQARATGDASMANALYQELIRVQGLEREDEQIAAAREAADLELALRYGMSVDQLAALRGGTGGNAGATGQQGTAGTTQSGGTPRKSPAKTGYDNGSLSAEQVKTLQAYYGLTQDGMWGPNSKSTTGMTAAQAWDNYINAGKTDSQQWTGNGSTGKGDYGSFDYDPDEGIFLWAGNAYHNPEALVRDMGAANMTDQQKKSLRSKMAAWGFDISFD